MVLNQIVEENKEDMIRTLQELIRIPSVEEEPEDGAPHGANVQKALTYMLETAREMGFHTCDYDHQVGYVEYGHGEQIAVVAHLDVVPAGDGWIHDPFGGELENGLIYGRGAIDDKGPAVSALYALYALKQSGLSIRKRIRILFGTNEENGSGDMKYYFEHGAEVPVMGFTPDGTYPVVNGEKGIVIATLQKTFEQEEGYSRLLQIEGGTAFNVVPASAFARIACTQSVCEKLKEKESDEIRVERTEDGVLIRAFGVSAHGSTPEKGRSAIGLLLGVLDEALFSPKLAKAVSFLNEKIGMETDGHSLGIAMSDPVSGGLTVNLGVIRGDESSLSVTVNYRYPVMLRYDDCAPLFNKVMAENGFRIVSQVHEKSLYMDPESKLVSTLLDVYEAQTGLSGKPLSIGGGTYAKSVPNIVAFGPTFPGDPDREHKPEECVETDQLVLNAKVYANAMYQLAK